MDTFATNQECNLEIRGGILVYFQEFAPNNIKCAKNNLGYLDNLKKLRATRNFYFFHKNLSRKIINIYITRHNPLKY